MLMLFLLASEPLACQQCARPAIVKQSTTIKAPVAAGKRAPVLKFGSKIRKK